MARKPSQDLVRRNMLPPNQGGYRAGKTTWENAARFAYDVYEGFERKGTHLWPWGSIWKMHITECNSTC